MDDAAGLREAKRANNSEIEAASRGDCNGPEAALLGSSTTFRALKEMSQSQRIACN
jgi:hypothetical protein